MDENLEKQLESLAEGEELTVEEDGDTVTYIKPKQPDLNHTHTFVEIGRTDKMCKCGQGRVG